MTACTNNGGKARRVVTAALVGVLSVGAVPAIALANPSVSDGEISVMAVEPIQNATLAAAVDAPGSRTSAKEGDNFAPNTGKYLVPTYVKIGGKDTKVDGTDLYLTYTAYGLDTVQSTKAADFGSYTGIGMGGKYFVKGADGKIDKDNPVLVVGNSSTAVLDAYTADLYFSGRLVDMDGKPVYVGEGSWSVKVSQFVNGYSYSTKEFRFGIKDAAAEGYTVSTKDGTGEFVFNNSKLFDGTDSAGSTGKDIVVLDATGRMVNGVRWYDTTTGDEVTHDVTLAGTYEGRFTDANGQPNKVTVTVAPLDLGNAAITIGTDGTFSPSDTLPDINNNITTTLWNKLSINGCNVGDFATGTGTGLGAILKVTSSTPADWSAKGEHAITFELDAEKAKPYGREGSVTGTGTVEYGVVDDDVSADLTVMYGDENVTNSGVIVNLIKGESFNPSLLKVRYNNVTYSGDDIDVTVKGDTSSETGINPVKVDVRLKSRAGSDGRYFGGNKEVSVWVNGADLDADERLYFYLDGELAGNTANVTYDGGNWLDRLEVVVKDGDGNELVEGADYDVTVTKDGKKVESAVDTGNYQIKVTGKTFDFDLGGNDTFLLTVSPLVVDRVDVVWDLEAEGYPYGYLTYTGEVLTPTFEFYNADDELVEVPAEAYEVTYTKNGKKAELKEVGVYFADFETAIDETNYVVNVSNVRIDVTDKGVFLDVPMDEWYSQGVYDAAKLGYMNGDGAGKTFSPMRELTRAEAACVLFNMAGGDTMYSNETIPGYDTEGEVYETGFSDVQGNEFFAKAVAWCEATGVINGYADGTFGVSRKVTNEEFACMLANYAKAKGENVTVEDADATLAEYPDASVVSDWAKDAVAWCVSEGIMGGGANISPAGSILRMRAATMAVNAQPKALTDLVITIPSVNK